MRVALPTLYVGKVSAPSIPKPTKSNWAKRDSIAIVFADNTISLFDWTTSVIQWPSRNDMCRHRHDIHPYHIYSGINYVLLLDNPLTRSISKLKPTCSKTLKAYLAATVVVVEKKIRAEIHGPVGGLFDGWTCNFEHYIALFAVYWSDGELKQPLLALAPRRSDRSVALRVHQENPGNLSPIRNVLVVPDW
ncbi:unnamed protein product [Phytophthora fragariaefolia]|uniref:Unnamed protein product n=1 Tax=Phytophthora fragariaefolia TaxID=1490495 RepID=A0A9W7CUJ4_9STRA|nr:unnamed protein product [Phytophthora fragariaefolia]